MSQIATFITVDTKGRNDSAEKRFPKTFRVAQPQNIFQLPHPQPLFVGGTTPEAILYRLGHPDQTLSPLINLSPMVLRQFRRLAYELRQQPSPLHLFCLVDELSPFGSNRILEESVRFFLALGSSIIVHLIVWQPVPSEFRRLWKEVKSFPAPVELGSVVPLSFLQENNNLARYLEILEQEGPEAFEFHLPLNRPYKLTPHRFTQSDRGLFLNHGLHGLNLFEQYLDDYFDHGFSSCMMSIPASQDIEGALNRSRHIVAYTTQPTYTQAYLGSELHHPYYENLTFRSSHELIESLLSPHLHSHKPPYRSLVFLDDSTEGDFDSLLASLIKQRQESLYYCHFVTPHQTPENNLISNMIIDRAYPYESLHLYS